MNEICRSVRWSWISTLAWRVRTDVYSIYRPTNGYNVKTQTNMEEYGLYLYAQGHGFPQYTADYTITLRSSNTLSFIILVTITLESISGLLSHVEWERLILSIWQAMSVKCVGSWEEGKSVTFWMKLFTVRPVPKIYSMSLFILTDLLTVQQVAHKKSHCSATTAAKF